MEWPCIPLPGWPDGDGEGVVALARSNARGRELATRLDSEVPVSGVTDGTLRPGMATIAVPATVDDLNMAGEDFAGNRRVGPFGLG